MKVRPAAVVVFLICPMVVKSFSSSPLRVSARRMKTALFDQEEPSSTFAVSAFDQEEPSSTFAVSAFELEKNLQGNDEKLTVRVVRNAGPSVAFVTSVLPMDDARRRRTSPPGQSQQGQQKDTIRGQPLGSGSAFVVDSEGYMVTNFHVIERAYQIQQMENMAKAVEGYIIGNLTQALEQSVIFDGLAKRIHEQKEKSAEEHTSTNGPRVYIRLDRSTQYQSCRIVDVKPELDLAVLKIEDGDSSSSSANSDDEVESFPALEFGSSSDLLVGQSLVAIGNPYGSGKFQCCYSHIHFKDPTHSNLSMCY